MAAVATQPPATEPPATEPWPAPARVDREPPASAAAASAGEPPPGEIPREAGPPGPQGGEPRRGPGGPRGPGGDGRGGSASCDTAQDCLQLADSYRDRNGSRRDMLIAGDLYEKACGLGSADGCTRRGFMYLKGRGVEPDRSRAEWFLRRGCDGGNGWACQMLRDPGAADRRR
jgi:TPR repeat protein